MTQQAYTGTLEVLQRHVGPCREWCHDKAAICGRPADYVIWGKLAPPEAFGPRCYDHAADHLGYPALAWWSGWALVNLRDLAFDVEAARDA